MVIKIIKFKLKCLIDLSYEIKDIISAIPKCNWLENNKNNIYSFYNPEYGLDTITGTEALQDSSLVLYNALYYKLPLSKTIYNLTKNRHD